MPAGTSTGVITLAKASLRLLLRPGRRAAQPQGTSRNSTSRTPRWVPWMATRPSLAVSPGVAGAAPPELHHSTGRCWQGRTEPIGCNPVQVLHHYLLITISRSYCCYLAPAMLSAPRREKLHIPAGNRLRSWRCIGNRSP